MCLWADGPLLLSPLPERPALDVTSPGRGSWCPSERLSELWACGWIGLFPKWRRALYASSLFNLPLHSVTGKSLSEQTSSHDSVTTGGGAVPKQPDNAHLSQRNLDALSPLSLLWRPPSLLAFSKQTDWRHKVALPVLPVPVPFPLTLSRLLLFQVHFFSLRHFVSYFSCFLISHCLLGGIDILDRSTLRQSSHSL